MNKKLKSAKILRYAKKIKSINYLGGKCINCNETDIFKITFHHIDKKEKEFEYGVYTGYKWSVIEKELDKCIPLCQNCHRELHYNEDNIHSRSNSKLIYLEYAGCSCSKCGYNKCPASLTFHHRNPDEKEFWLGNVSKQVKSIIDLDEYIKNEIDKCDILCSNCHVIEHSDVEFYEEYKNEIYYKVENYKEIQPKIDREIVRKMYMEGIKQIDIAKHFNASKGTISGIIKNMEE